MTTTENNKRIAKNTLLLYFRMLFMMVVSLYTSRVVLSALGVEDFGLYNVVGGVVAMFSILSGSLSAAISRFITYELGKNNILKLKIIFSSAITIQIGLGIVIAFFAETIGLWFLNTKMNIPIERIVAANWVLQFSIITFIINLISIPYNAVIIAHEKMSAFAYISIFEAMSKLFIAYLITISPIDKLIFYAILMCTVAIAIRLTYGYYCKRHFDECCFHFIWNKEIFQQIFSFAGWNFIGASSAVLRDQGGNIIINLFYGPTVNAARGIAFQVSNAIQGFVSNFMTALNPQITKSYASKDYTYMMTLIFQGARLSFYMLLLFSLPVIINTHYLLTLWLNTVPEHTVLFVQLVLIFAMSESISGPLITAMLATGEIRNYQIIVGGLQMLNLPISYVLLRSGAIPEIVFVVAILISQCCLMARLYMLKKMIKLRIKDYLKKVYFNIIIVSSVAIILPICIQEKNAEGFINFLLNSLICMLCTYLSIYYIGCSHKERKFIYNKFLILKSKIIHK